MKQSAEMTRDELWDRAVEEAAVMGAEASARSLGALLARPDGEGGAWYVAPGCDPVSFFRPVHRPTGAIGGAE